MTLGKKAYWGKMQETIHKSHYDLITSDGLSAETAKIEVSCLSGYTIKSSP